MSEKPPSFNDAKYLFMGPSLVMANKDTGKPVFSMKRKEPMRPDGTTDLYYIFQIHEKNMNEEDRKSVKKALEEFMAPLARTLDIGLFNFDEISERSTEQVKKLYEAGKELKEEQIDVSIEVFNYATKKLGTLVVGISTKAAEDIENIPEEWKK